MRLSQAVLLALLAGWPAAGCLPARSGTDPTLAGPRFGAGTATDVVRIDVAVIERPAGDRYLNHALWDLADEQAVDLERKTALDDNGFRVGLIGGMVPAEMLTLLTSEKSCADPHRLQLRAGHSTSMGLGGEQARVRFALNQGEKAAPVELAKALCEFEVVPSLADGGRVTLRFTPLVKHGSQQREPRALHDASGERSWAMMVQQPTETYENLSWEITVAPDEYVVVGTRLEQDDTLGRCFFLDTESRKPVQRLLVIRTGRAAPDATPDEVVPGKAVPPLALQASWGTVRGMGPGGEAAGHFP
jgi:hypothetical protein